MENPRHDRHATSHQYALQVIEFDTQHLTALYHIPQTYSTSLYTLYYLISVIVYRISTFLLYCTLLCIVVHLAKHVNG